VLGRRLLAPALLSAALCLPAPAAAKAKPARELPPADVAGVSVKRLPKGVVRVTFSKRKASIAAYKRMAGRDVKVTCTEFGRPSPGDKKNTHATTSIKMPRQRATVVLNRLTRPYSVCSFFVPGSGRIMVVALSRLGRAFLADAATTQTIEQVVQTARQLAAANADGHVPTAAELAQRVRLVVELKRPSDTPATDRIGFFSDGRSHISAVKVSSAGRRLFYELDGNVVRTNVRVLLERVTGLDG
jgi:hypothetical protein